MSPSLDSFTLSPPLPSPQPTPHLSSAPSSHLGIPLSPSWSSSHYFPMPTPGPLSHSPTHSQSGPLFSDDSPNSSPQPTSFPLDISPSPEGHRNPTLPASLPHERTSSLPSHLIVTRSKSHIQCPKIRYDGTIPWPPSRSLKLAASITTITPSIPDEPHSFSEAFKHHEWHLAMLSEIDALLFNQTWDLVPPSPTYNLLGSKWVLKTQRQVDGTFERHKTRLVA